MRNTRMNRAGRACAAVTALAFLSQVCAQSQYNPARIVANITADCPVPNVKYTPAEYSTGTLVTAFAPLISSAPPTPCSSQAQSLATCAFDGSLGVKTGCCSIACSAQMKQLQTQNCIPEILGYGCNATAAEWTTIQPFIPVLLSAADRCVGYQSASGVVCPTGRVIANATSMAAANTTSGANATSPAGANATAAGNTTAAGNMTVLGAANTTAAGNATAAGNMTGP